ncbi:uncharacterized protein [Miscanthus floridulus]|uniref:uncharacterized protein n=1 Tax=Miscanthus floridulus TaxID=154761 RepID=UPI00345B2DD1
MAAGLQRPAPSPSEPRHHAPRRLALHIFPTYLLRRRQAPRPCPCPCVALPAALSPGAACPAGPARLRPQTLAPVAPSSDSTCMPLPRPPWPPSLHHPPRSCRRPCSARPEHASKPAPDIARGRCGARARRPRVGKEAPEKRKKTPSGEGNVVIGWQAGRGRMPMRGKASKPSYGRMTENTFDPLPLPSGVPVPMCFYSDPCKTPPPLCDFEQWIDTEIKPEDKEWIQKLLQWEAEDKEMMEKIHREEAVKKEHKEEEERRRVATYREEREKKLERARRATAAMEENSDVLRKEKWPHCT